MPESNQRPTDYKSVALPSELKRLLNIIKSVTFKELPMQIGIAKVYNKLISANFFQTFAQMFFDLITTMPQAAMKIKSYAKSSYNLIDAKILIESLTTIPASKYCK